MRLFFAVLVLLLGYLLFWPVPINPVAWQAPTAPELTGDYAINDRLATVTRHAQGVGLGPEDVAVDSDGNIFVGYVDGRLVRFDADGNNPDLLANTNGRPLGLAFDQDGNLIVADAEQGLLKVAMSGKIEVLSTEADGVPFRFTDDVDVAADGRIFFSDASSKFGPALHARDDILEHGGHGRLLMFDPASGETTTLLSNLEFANGVAVAPDQQSVLVTQTGSYNIIRYWIAGERAGDSEIFFDNLPGIPDGMSSNGRDTYWVALFAPRNALLDHLSDLPFLRKMAFRLPMWMQPQPATHAFILGLSLDGRVTHNLQHVGADSFYPITSVEEVNGKLYLGSLTQPAFATINVPTGEEADE